MKRSHWTVLALLALGGCGAEGSEEVLPAQNPARDVGLWHPLRVAEVDPALQDLAALPYLGSKTSAESGSKVARFDLDHAQDGYNLVVAAHAPEATLTDMKGRTLHTWRADAATLWPDDPAAKGRAGTYWRHAALLPDGGVVASFDGIGLVGLDRGSKVVWRYRGAVRGSFSVAADGAVCAAAGDAVVVVGPDGAERTRVALAACWGDGPRPSSLQANGAHAVDAETALVSLGDAGCVALLDLTGPAVVWQCTGKTKGQNDPSPLPGGRFLVFDNVVRDGVSRAVEFDGASGELAWSYEGDELAPLWSATHGAAQRLRNGNTLIVESEAGRAFEVTPGGEIVWEFFNPSEGERVADLCLVERLDRAVVEAAFPAFAQAGGGEIDLGGAQSLIDNGK